MQRTYSLFLLGISLLLVSLADVNGQQDSLLYSDLFSDNTSADSMLLVYLDSIDKYIFRDKDITQHAFKVCDKILLLDQDINKSIEFEYKLRKITFQLSNQSATNAFQIITETEKDLDTSKIDQTKLLNFNYYKAFTYMSLGDIDEAQKIFYANIEHAWSIKDTNAVINNNYSLGQLYADQNKFDAAIKCYKRNLEIFEVHKALESTIALSLYELAETYYFKGDYSAAQDIIKKGLQHTEENNLEIIHGDFMLYKGRTYLKQGNINAAEASYNSIAKNEKLLNDPFSAPAIKTYLAELYTAKKEYQKALEVYTADLALSDTTAFEANLTKLQKAHELSKITGNTNAAYDYLLEYTKLNAIQEDKKRKQKTDYLKIKYETEKQQKDNKLLEAEIDKSKSKQTILYFLLSLIGVFFLFLFLAFTQKEKYNRTLKQEVKRRTEKLSETNSKLTQSNKDLDEFNKILSHDIKEPLRNIIGFTQLATQELSNSEKLKEYLLHVETGGIQLNNLINSVEKMREVNTIKPSQPKNIDLHNLVNEITTALKTDFPHKTINLKTTGLSKIVSYRQILQPVIYELMNNAIKFNTNNPVNLVVNYSKARGIEHIDIEDNGIGIDSDYHQKMFDMFERLNNRGEYDGPGLGLSIAARTLDHIQGTISVLESTIGQGTKIRISFPTLVK